MPALKLILFLFLFLLFLTCFALVPCPWHIYFLRWVKKILIVYVTADLRRHSKFQELEWKLLRLSSYTTFRLIRWYFWSISKNWLHLWVLSFNGYDCVFLLLSSGDRSILTLWHLSLLPCYLTLCSSPYFCQESLSKILSDHNISMALFIVTWQHNCFLQKS